jgi:Flp pilus assembly protein TadD
VVAVQEKLAEDHPNRLASQHELARAYQANGQVEQAVALLEHVVALKRRRYAETHPSRVVSEKVLDDLLQSIQNTVL